MFLLAIGEQVFPFSECKGTTNYGTNKRFPVFFQKNFQLPKLYSTFTRRIFCQQGKIDKISAINICPTLSLSKCQYTLPHKKRNGQVQDPTIKRCGDGGAKEMKNGQVQDPTIETLWRWRGQRNEKWSGSRPDH